MKRVIKKYHSNTRPVEFRFFTISDVANFLDVSTRTVRRWIEKKLLIAHRIGGLLRISEADFQAFLTVYRVE